MNAWIPIIYFSCLFVFVLQHQPLVAPPLIVVISANHPTFFCLFFCFWFFFWGFFSPSLPFWIWPSKRCTIQFFLHCSHLFMYKNGWWWWHSNDCFKQCYDFSQLLELVGTYKFVRKIIFSDDGRGGGGGKPFKLHLNQNCYILGINHNFVGF